MATKTETQPAELKSVPSVPTASHPAHVAIEVNPSALKRGGYNQAGPIRLVGIRPAKTKAANNNNADLLTEGDFYTAGSHIITWEAYEALLRHPMFSMLKNKRVIVVHLPESVEKSTGTTKDYALESAYTLIEQANDVEWLQRCIAKDDRDGIAEACQGRIKAIEEELSRPELGDEK